MIEIKETTEICPLCPHCESEIRTIYSQKVKSVFGVRFIYYCEDCKKALSISHRKGFWMG